MKLKGPPKGAGQRAVRIQGLGFLEQGGHDCPTCLATAFAYESQNLSHLGFLILLTKPKLCSYSHHRKQPRQMRRIEPIQLSRHWASCFPGPGYVQLSGRDSCSGFSGCSCFASELSGVLTWVFCLTTFIPLLSKFAKYLHSVAYEARENPSSTHYWVPFI